MRGGDLAEVRLRRHEPGRNLPHLRAHLRQISRRPSADVERGAYPRLGVAEFPARALREVVAPQHRADGRRRRHGAFLHRLGHQARHGERGRPWRIICTASRTMQAAFAKYEDARRTEVLRLQSAARNSHGMVRGRRALPAPRSGAVQLFAADALAAHQPRELAAARQELARRRRGLVPAPRRRRRQHSAAADVRAVPAARHAA